MPLILVVLVLLLLFGGGGGYWYGNRAGWGTASFAPFGGIILLLVVLWLLHVI